jgi:hypothetical protein
MQPVTCLLRKFPPGAYRAPELETFISSPLEFELVIGAGHLSASTLRAVFGEPQFRVRASADDSASSNADSSQLSTTYLGLYNRSMAVFDDKQEELEHYETMMGVPRGRLAVTMDLITDAMAFVGQHGVYCQSQRWPGKPVMDIQIVMKNLTDAKQLIQSVMEDLKNKS